ncbi:hypothetical protein SAMN04489841_2541 [Natrinema salaciae]|uniref:Uncharacterized protein n=1 Tax=Natrinema salaciae TaxID=1186196 RepID=A0A1H9JG51_9EURY|nr:hypothetical protein SAMN04489841_2541 [Natrinema salaciae]
MRPTEWQPVISDDVLGTIGAQFKLDSNTGLLHDLMQICVESVETAELRTDLVYLTDPHAIVQPNSEVLLVRCVQSTRSATISETNAISSSLMPCPIPW